MLDLEDVGDVIATRDLEISDGSTVQVVIGQPQSFPNGQDFFCPYQITGIGNEKIRHAGGVDSLQALLLALQMISAELYTSDESRAGTLTWLGRRNFGIPVAPPIEDLVPNDAE